MDQSAIQQIQRSTSELATAANESLNTATLIKGAPFVMVPEGFKIQELNVEKHEPLRRRFTGSFKTSSIDDFTDYSAINADSNSVCFIDSEYMTAQTILNIGSRNEPGHCDDIATLDLIKTAEYIALLEKQNVRSSQKSMAEWLEEYGDCIRFLNSEHSVIEPQKAINCIRKITITANSKSDNESTNYRESRNLLESIEATADENSPEYFVFTCEPYSGLKRREFTCRISIIASEQAPIVLFKILRIESAKEEMGKELQDSISDKFMLSESKFIKTYLAKFNKL